MVLIGLLVFQVQAQISFPVNGVRAPENRIVLIQNAWLHPDTSANAYLGEILIKNEWITEIGPTVNHPDEAVRFDFQGKHVYPSFIDPISDYGMGEVKRSPSRNYMLSSKEGAFYWNEALRSELKASELFVYKDDQASKLREAGYGIVQTHIPDGISRGSACIVSLKQANEHEVILVPESAHCLSFNKGSSTQDYPNSLMGSIALIRQAYLDGLNYELAIKPKETNLSIEAWNQLQQLTQLFICSNPLDLLRAQKIAGEFHKSYQILGSGKEYQILDAFKKDSFRLILPINFPPVYNVEDPYDLLRIDLSDLKHWELAASNPAILAKAGISFVFTGQDLKDRKDILTNVRKSLQRGLSERQALYALTLGPAEYLNIQSKAGSLAKNKLANFIVSDLPIFQEKSSIKENWIQGTRYNFSKTKIDSISGTYELHLDPSLFTLTIEAEGDKMDFKLKSKDSLKLSLNAKIQEGYITGKLNRGNPSGDVLFSCYKTETGWKGNAQLENGSWQSMSIVRLKQLSPTLLKKDSIAVKSTDSIGDVFYPFGAYGWKTKPIAKTYLIKNTTVWTNEKEGILKNTDVLIQNGKITALAKNLQAAQALVIDGTNKHLTAGIIDEHSHIAVNGGVNECSESNTSEVRIGDVINSDDINIYRQLSGGVTTAHILHGSCNPIGGQTALIKLRWGYLPEAMKFEKADGFIKFALGENVKRSGGNQGGRYPDSRMGVEQVYLDAFTRAKEYDALRKADPAHTRQNLELDAIAEIINKKRFITCHSYVQSEINMLMKVAERFNFKVNTFTHILEGYKVADKLKQHGAGAAGFSDWWAYKYEVYEAIPYNGALLHDQGVVTAFNSDDAEMARRLNQEAAKAVMYGNVPEEEALKFVTLNPAKLLHIDDRVGSIKKGKDADLVLWNDHPLSIKASVEKTFVDGILFFDKEQDLILRTELSKERNRIVQKMIKAKAAGEGAENFSSRPRRLYHCDSIGE